MKLDGILKVRLCCHGRSAAMKGDQSFIFG